MRAAIYARISQDTEGTELGVTRQQDDCRREADRRGWDVEQVYIDNDVSATKSKRRPAYQDMLRDIRTGRIQAVIVWSMDRLTRTPRELEDIIDLADRQGLALANVGGHTDLSTPAGRAFARSLGAFARLETDNLATRLRRKFQEKAEKGEPHGYSPFGFTRVAAPDSSNPERITTRDVIEPSEAAIVREVARRVLALESLRSVATDLNNRGIPSPRAAQWSSTILRQILVRPANAGLRQHQGKVIGRSTGDAIYDEDTHNRLVALLKDPTRKSNHVGPGYKYLLSGIAICGRCGGVMRRQIGRTQLNKTTGISKRQPPSYNCSVCFKVRRKQEAVDEVVSEVLIARLSQPDAIALFAASDSTAAAEAQAAIQAIDAKLDLVADQFADDTITAGQLKRITTKLRSERALAENRLRAAQPSTAVADLVGGDVRAKWAAMPIAARREVVETLVTVTIKPAGSGQRFDPEDVAIEWLS